MAAEDAPWIEVEGREALRDWLAAHHASAQAVWLVTPKLGQPGYVPSEARVAELLCWGWIDSTPRKVDATRTRILIAPRNPGSAWSALNKRLVEEERAAGRMTPAGEAAIARALENGMWSFLDDVEAGIVPDDLDDALGPLREVWDGWPRTVRRGTLEWIKTAKTAPTRANRIEDVRASAEAGQRPSIFRRP